MTRSLVPQASEQKEESEANDLPLQTVKRGGMTHFHDLRCCEMLQPEAPPR